MGHGRINAVYIRMDECVNYGSSANPFWVFRALGEEPQNQNQIAKKILKIWNVPIDRKAVGRHLQLLQNLGYPVQHGPEGYFRGGEPGTPKTDVPYNSSAYPLLILQVLNGSPKTQTAIIKAVQEKYGVRIDRKTVVRNLKMLEALGVLTENEQSERRNGMVSAC